MAQKVQVMLLDDIDGSNATETVRFGLDGVSYEIDLSEKNANKLRKDLSVWLDSARRATGGSRVKNGRKSGRGTNTDDVSAIRDWAKKNGYEVSERGRISAALRDAYEAATK
ncbi:MAG: histone-like nucleoid-structuring protein Lsr2 [Actinomycetota bacterium]